MTQRAKDLSERFLRFADEAEQHESPLYSRLARHVASQGTLLDLARTVPREPVPNLFFAAVHDLLLLGQPSELATYYPSRGGRDNGPGLEDAFSRFCEQQCAAIVCRLENCLVQTNEVRRSACLLPAFLWVAKRVQSQALSFIEVGSSAGLLLAWDQYHYRYSDGQRWGDSESALALECENLGEPLTLGPCPRIERRVAIDLSPIDPNDADATRWLRALIWPEHRERADRLEAALQVVRRVSMDRVRGDALDVLPVVLRQAPTETPVCVFHSSTLNQFESHERERFQEILTQEARQRELFVLGANGRTVELMTFEDEATAVALVEYDSHGRWLRWVYEEAEDDCAG